VPPPVASTPVSPPAVRPALSVLHPANDMTMSARTQTLKSLICYPFGR
jgi:hypothetical protein